MTMPPSQTDPSVQIPLSEEVGLLEARTMLGQMANAAQVSNRVTYLTRHGRRVAAIVSVDAALALQRSRDEQPREGDVQGIRKDASLRADENQLQALATDLARAAARLADALDDPCVPPDMRRRVQEDQATAREIVAGEHPHATKIFNASV